VLDAAIAVGIVVLLGAGFWWTRGTGGMLGGMNDPAQEALDSEPVDRLTPPPEREDREHQVE
jgi:hypothetical protein